MPPGFILPPDISGPMPADVAPHVAAVARFGTPDPWFLNLVEDNAPSIHPIECTQKSSTTS